MRNILLHISVFVLTAWIATVFGGWWGIWVGGLLVGIISWLENKQGILWSFIGGFAFWLIWSTLLLQDGGHLIHGKIAELLNLSSSWLLSAISAFLGGLLGLLGYLAGRVFRL